ncbi:MAG: ATP-dependent zinc protease [Moraxellaceae bacterium]|nr:ATP-dependent zinc protease [Moraxellaceae bacterium]MDP1776184.1 ATP-dependent zinc protease [Moraxellaceae bacterium]MDZ4298919.1 ATP-dependent zinc protease [Moraxellaceae bacterium]MDZ4387664.1 ATP-dependent zinc protease [Moraxellaceae bacterium]
MLFKLQVFVLTLLLSACAIPTVQHVEPADVSRIEQQLLDQSVEMLMLQEQNAQMQGLLEGLEQTLKQIANRQNALAAAAVRAQTIPAASQPVAASTNGKMIVGEIEPIYLFDPNLVYDARIDSGAQTSSIDARNITRFERDGKAWVRFDLPVPGGGAEKFVTLERKVVRNVRILQSTSDGAQRRAVVHMQFAIGSHKQVAEFTLTGRDNLTFPILIGRNVLRDIMLVDVGKQNKTKLPAELLDQVTDVKK